MTHRDRAGEPPGASASLDDVPHRPRLPSCPADRPRDRHGGFPKFCGPGLLGGVPHGLRCPASPRHALLAGNLGKPSLWVIIKDLWYNGIGAGA